MQRGPDVIATPPGRIPPMQDSDEADQTLLRLAREQGAATEKALEYMLHQQAVAGQETRAGDYLVAYAVEYAEGFYARAGDELSYQRTDASAETNVHVEVCVRDGADGRFIPGLNVYATLFDAQGHELGTKREPFMWHPWLYHYGENWRVPGSGDYRLRIRIEQPDFRRHDVQNGRRYRGPVTVEFTRVPIKAGQK
ncbi:MAG TPA: iron transporter [Polyangiales bacterium]